MIYYKSNALYEHLQKINNPRFTFCTGDKWQLVYGDGSSNPKLLILLCGVGEKEIDNQFNFQDLSYLNLKIVSERSKLPLIVVRFINDIPEIENVSILENESQFKKISLKELSEIFKKHGLPIKENSTAKYLNDKSSSAYHNWQRSSLGANLTVSDIDLWEIKEGLPVCVFELKRSYYELSRWRPFSDDYANFRLVGNLVIPVGISFKIIYNRRIKDPFQDIIDPLKIFNVEISPSLSISKGDEIPLSDFTKM